MSINPTKEPEVTYNLRYSNVAICTLFNRIETVNKRLKKELQVTEDDVVLDIGCNKGELVEFLRPHCKGVIGIDINKEAIESSSVSGLRVLDARQTDFPDAYFSKIVSSHTIEHIPSLEKSFKEMDRILKPGGMVVLHYPWELFRGMAAMRSSWAFFGTPFKGHRLHLNWLSHRRIEKLAVGTRLRVVSRRFFFDPLPGYITVLKR